MHPSHKDIGAFIDADQYSITIQSVDAASDVNGASVDRLDYGSCVIVALTGAATGTPSAQSHRFKVQESADDSTWSDVTDATITIAADDTSAELDLDLTARKRYLRVVYDASNSSFTDGTSPANDIAATIVLGGAVELPV